MNKALVISFNLKLLFGLRRFFGLHAILIILPNLAFNSALEVLQSASFIEWNLIKFLEAFTILIAGLVWQ